MSKTTRLLLGGVGGSLILTGTASAGSAGVKIVTKDASQVHPDLSDPKKTRPLRVRRASA